MMSRSGYSDDCDGWALIRWRGAVKAAIKGRRGQQALRDIVAALDALPEHRLASGSLVTADGEYCTLGALGRARCLDMATIDPEDRSAVADAFGIAEALAAEIMFENDEDYWGGGGMEYFNFTVYGPMRPWESHTQLRWRANPKAAERRWSRMRAWAQSHISATPTTGG
jgi:hypothetical protein